MQNPNIQKRLNQALEICGSDLNVLARRLRVSPVRVRRWVSGKKIPASVAVDLCLLVKYHPPAPKQPDTLSPDNPLTEDWMREVAEILRGYGLVLSSLKVRTSIELFVHARWHVAHHLRTKRSWSLVRIAKLFGQDHTTVMHGLRRWRELQDLSNETPHEKNA